MAEPVVVQVRILGLHVGCDACGDRQHIAAPGNEGDVFTQRFLEPLWSWWTAHYQPQPLLFEVLVDGEYAEWEATGRGLDL